VSEQGLRKALYQKILAAFPEGWMSSGQVSREGEEQWMVLVPCDDISFQPSERDEEEIREGGAGEWELASSYWLGQHSMDHHGTATAQFPFALPFALF
jgi:hypothetical protein